MAEAKKTKVQTRYSEKLKYALVFVFIAAAYIAYYALGKTVQAPWLQYLVLLLGFLAAAATLWYSKAGQDSVVFVQGTVRELKKVVWPAPKQAFQTTLYVLAFILVVALFLWLTDKTLEWLLYGVLLGWRTA